MKILNEKYTLKITAGCSILHDNTPKETGKGGGVAFINKDTILFQELKLKT